MFLPSSCLHTSKRVTTVTSLHEKSHQAALLSCLQTRFFWPWGLCRGYSLFLGCSCLFFTRLAPSPHSGTSWEKPSLTITYINSTLPFSSRFPQRKQTPGLPCCVLTARHGPGHIVGAQKALKWMNERIWYLFFKGSLAAALMWLSPHVAQEMCIRIWFFWKWKMIQLYYFNLYAFQGSWTHFH